MTPVNPPNPLTKTFLDPRGIVFQTPDMIRGAAQKELGRQITPGASALARMIASETDPRHPETAQIRAHIALNDLADLHSRHPDWHWASSIDGVITYSSIPAHNGYFGQQRWGRRYASDKDYNEPQLLAAEKAIADHAAGIDPTGGALKFIDRRAMGGVQAGTGSFDAKVAEWAGEGLHPFTLRGYPDDLYVFRRRA